MTLAAAPPPPPRVAVFYGSQTGCAESIAKRIYDEAHDKGLDASFQPLNAFQGLMLSQPASSSSPSSSSSPTLAIIVCSTTGNGDPPDNAAKFWRYIKRRTQPKDLLAAVPYTVLGLGDTNYDKFCYMGKSIDKRMHELGAERFYEMVAADEAMGLEDSVEPWLAGLWPAVKKHHASDQGDGEGDAAETCSSSDSDSGRDPSSAEGAATTESAAAAGALTPSPVVPANVRPYDALFPAPTEIPEDIPRLQSPLYALRYLDDGNEDGDVASTTTPTETNGEYCAARPFLAVVRAARYLTRPQSERKVLFVELDTTDSGITYQPGDAIGIKCPNRESTVSALLTRLELDGTKRFCLEPVGAKAKRPKATAPPFPSPCSVRELFLHHVDLQSPPKKATLRALATYCADENERTRLLVLSSKSGADTYTRFITDQRLGVAELLHLFPSCRPPLEHLVSLLPQLMPRFYSITTSPLADPHRMGIAFTVVDELVGPEGTIRRRGLCTEWLEALCAPLLDNASPPPPPSAMMIRVPMFLRPTRDFVLPASHEWPLILIGPGTGVAPFMGFLEHRRLEVTRRAALASAVCSGSWRGGLELELVEDAEFHEPPPSQATAARGTFLFFGCRRAEEDWIFEDAMRAHVAAGTLRGLFTAFSRAQAEKHYVQHELRRHGALVADLVLQGGGYVYVCGDGTQMARDVHAALQEVLQEHGGLSAEDAEQRLRDLATRQRYVRDIW